MGLFEVIASSFAYNVLKILEFTEFREEFTNLSIGIFNIHDPLQYLHIIPIFTFGFGLLKLAAGLGLRTRRAWAEKLSIVLAVLMLFSFPIGTALGIYTIWVYVEEEKQKSINN